MYAPPEYAQASARLRKDVVTEGGEIVGNRRKRAIFWVLKHLQSFLSHHTPTSIYFARTSLIAGLDKEDQVLANTKETAHNQFVVPLVNCK